VSDKAVYAVKCDCQSLARHPHN